MKPLLKQLKLANAIGLDFETFWANDYTLKKQPTTEYINDPRFEVQIVSVQAASWGRPRVMEIPRFRTWAKTIDWSKTALLAHNAAFDGYIAFRHFGIKPAFYFDTMSMLRPIIPVSVGGSLKAGCAAFGRSSKLHASALVNTKGKRWAEFTKDEKAALKTYAGDDIEDCWFLFDRLRPYIPLDELRLIDMTMKMYCQPQLLLDKPMLLELAKQEIARKAKLLERFDKADLMSNDKFAVILEAALDGPAPTKISKTTGKETYAFSKQDAEFKKLLQHDDEEVRALVEARLGVKSTIVETRAQRMAARADYGPQPIYYRYWGAGTGRWSGGDSINWQNMSRGSDMRKAILAPRGHTLVIADLSQIEARINAWFAGQQNIVDAFARGDDVYCMAASDIYHRRITKADMLERFIGKICVLMLQYGAGWERFAEVLRLGTMGPAVAIDDAEARVVHRGWRQANPFIVAGWKATDNKIRSAFLGGMTVEDKCVAYQGVGKNGFMHLPGGMAVRYDDVRADEDGVSYLKKMRGSTEIRGRLYGGLYVENRTQALARRVIAEHMLAAADAMPYWRQAMTTHDEIVGVVPNRQANRALKIVTEIMTSTPSWAKGLPLAVDAHVSQRYDK